MRIKNFMIAAVVLAPSTQAQAQFAINPQAGAHFTQLTNTPSGLVSSASFGWQLGADLRLGDRLYFQPGAFFGRSATYIKFTPMDTTFIEHDLIRTTAKIKALLGYNLVHKEMFKLRANAGPTYEVLLSVDSRDEKIGFNKKDYNEGSFNLDAGLGMDIALVTLEGGVSYGLSNAYKDAGKLMGNSQYFTWYVTVGVVLGGGK